jgi:CBS domain-containing protein
MVNETMTESVVEVSPEAPVSIALAILDRHGVGGAPVVNAGPRSLRYDPRPGRSPDIGKAPGSVPAS